MFFAENLLTSVYYLFLIQWSLITPDHSSSAQCLIFNIAEEIYRIHLNLQLLSHFNHNIWNIHHLPKLWQISFVKTQKSYRQTKEKKISQENFKKWREKKTKKAVYFFKLQSQLHEEKVIFLFLWDHQFSFYKLYCDCLGRADSILLIFYEEK